MKWLKFLQNGQNVMSPLRAEIYDNKSMVLSPSEAYSNFAVDDVSPLDEYLGVYPAYRHALKFEIRALLDKGRVEAALDKLQEVVTRFPNSFETFVMLSGQYQRLLRDQRRGFLSREDVQVERKKIVKMISELADELAE